MSGILIMRDELIESIGAWAHSKIDAGDNNVVDYAADVLYIIVHQAPKAFLIDEIDETERGTDEN